MIYLLTLKLKLRIAENFQPVHFLNHWQSKPEVIQSIIVLLLKFTSSFSTLSHKSCVQKPYQFHSSPLGHVVLLEA